MNAETYATLTAAEKIAFFIESVASGKTLYVGTHCRQTKITKRNLKSFAKIDRPLLNAEGDSMYMSVGNRYDCIDFCKFTIEG